MARSAETTVAVGDESSRNPRGTTNASEAAWRRHKACDCRRCAAATRLFRFVILSVGSSRTRHPRLLLFWRYAPGRHASKSPFICERWCHSCSDLPKRRTPARSQRSVRPAACRAGARRGFDDSFAGQTVRVARRSQAVVMCAAAIPPKLPHSAGYSATDNDSTA